MHFGGSRKPLYDFVQAVNSNFRCIFKRFGDIAGFVRPDPIFPYPTPIPAEIWDVHRSAMMGSAESRKVRLISREIIF